MSQKKKADAKPKKRPEKNDTANLTSFQQSVNTQYIPSVELRKLIEARVNESRVSSSDVSFNELLDMYTNRELIITPEFQRTFRWTIVQESRFIESLILELPIPPIFVVEIDDGQYELVDGLQRISTYLHFRGKLPDKFIKDRDRPHAGYDDEDFVPATLPEPLSLSEEMSEPPSPSQQYKPLTLYGCEIIRELNGRTFDDLPFAIQIALKRYFVRMHAIRKSSREDLKYHMFKRLNQGGTALSSQELRNSFIRIVNDKFIKFINRCSIYPDFWTCVKSISQNSAEALYHQELVLRFFAFKNNRNHYVHDISSFLDDYLEGVSLIGDHQLAFDYEFERSNFEKTFRLLSASTGENTFRAYQKVTSTGRFRSLLFEAITIGIQDFVSTIQVENNEHISLLAKALQTLKQDDKFQKLTTGGGKNYLPELNRRIDKVREIIHRQLSAKLQLPPLKKQR